MVEKTTNRAAVNGSAANTLKLEENKSTVDDGMSVTRLVTKSDGSKVPFSEEHLRSALNAQLSNLDSEHISVDIIINKVSSGLYNGKFFLFAGLVQGSEADQNDLPLDSCRKVGLPAYNTTLISVHLHYYGRLFRCDNN